MKDAGRIINLLVPEVLMILNLILQLQQQINQKIDHEVCLRIVTILKVSQETKKEPIMLLRLKLWYVSFYHVVESSFFYFNVSYMIDLMHYYYYHLGTEETIEQKGNCEERGRYHYH